MTRDARDRLEDILHAIDEIDRRLGEQLPDDALHDALCFHLLVIGEAVKRLDPETSRQAPEVQWQRIAGLRDVIVHDSQNDHDGFDIFGAGGASSTGETGRGLVGLRYGDATPAYNGG